MLTLLFGICMLMVVGKLLVFGIRVSWGIAKMFVSVILFPLVLIGMVFAGLLSFAFPILLLAGIGAFLLRD